jgi:hypothetical protein
MISKIIELLKKHGLCRDSKSFKDYEYCKSILYPEIETEISYDKFIKIITDYLGI